LLDIPRGVSCYADHMLDDYVLKIVPLHLEQASIVIATSARIKRELLTIAPHADPDRILVKPNAVDSRQFRAPVRPEHKAGEPFRLVCVSRIEPKKGILYLADAVRHLLDRGIDVSVHVLGGVDNNEVCRNYAQAVEARIRELGLTGALHLEGRLDGSAIRRFLQNSHLFVAPFVETETGDKDGIPTSLLEAMASGLTAVATDAGSITEVIGDGHDGLIVGQRDGKALADAIERLLSNEQMRSRMGEQAAAKIRKSFDVSICERAFHDRIRGLKKGAAERREITAKGGR
jgi:colanic acid/amylovoran biosynthesis glycosyltransferase